MLIKYQNTTKNAKSQT